MTKSYSKFYLSLCKQPITPDISHDTYHRLCDDPTIDFVQWAASRDHEYLKQYEQWSKGSFEVLKILVDSETEAAATADTEALPEFRGWVGS